MLRLYSAHHITLHVRESNKAAIALYKGTLGFEETGVEKGYCGCCFSLCLRPKGNAEGEC